LRAWPEGDVWHAETEAGPVAARAIVNAAGPWVADVLETRLGHRPDKGVRLIKGSHIVVTRLYDGEDA